MSTVRERAVENASIIVSLLILGAGFVALFGGLEYFFVIWIVGFAVVLPIITILSGEANAAYDSIYGVFASVFDSGERDADDRTTDDSIRTIRDRYARGELSHEQFERKIDRLLETEDLEKAAEWHTRSRTVEREQS